MIGIGILGAGRICAAHATSALALRDTRLVGIADIDAARAAQASEKYGCPGHADPAALLADPAVDAVVVGLPHGLHLEATLASLRAGKHVLLEKPMARTAAECDAMLAAAAEAGRTLMVAHSQQFFPVNQAARRLIREGGIGIPVIATDTWYKPFFEGVRPPWFLEDAQGGGMWPMNGSHMIDRLTFLLGSRVTAVRARVGSLIHGVSTDTGLAFLELENGVSAVISHVGYKDGVNRFEAEITGTEAQLKLSGDRGGGGEFWISRAGKWEAVPAEMPELALKPGANAKSPFFAAELQEFARAVTEGREPSVTGEYGRYVVRVMEACVESSRAGREIRLEA